MKNVSLKIEDSIFKETEEILSLIKKPRNRYINEAIASYNKKQKRILIENALREDSKLVSDDSLSVLGEFENIEDEN